MLGIPASLYQWIILVIVIFFTLERFSFVSSLRGYGILTVNDSRSAITILTVFLIFFIGFRPIDVIFTDMVVYRRLYEGIAYNLDLTQGDILFELMMYGANKIMPVEFFFFLIAVIYIGCMYVGCIRLVKTKADILMLFCLGAYSFYAYAVNGLRNGMACSIVIMAITYICGPKKEFLKFLVFSAIAVGVHKSTLLPVAAVVFAHFWKNPKAMFYFWLLSIPMSLAFGGAISGFISGFGFDDRMAYYASEEALEEYGYIFSSTGFRWDFLLYSFMPILLGWYVVIKRKIEDQTYYYILACYLYSNAFWVMVISSLNSNRFAYLSWFIYPIALGYPLLKLPVFKHGHSQKTAWILFAHLSFTVFMTLIGK